MKITMMGALGHIGRPLLNNLLHQHDEVTVITHSNARQAEIEALGATAAIGDSLDVTFLTEAFKGADAVFVMATFAPSVLLGDPEAPITQAAHAYLQALTAAKVLRVVALSSVGADDPQAGTVSYYGQYEQILGQYNGALTFIRPVGFYTNLLGDLKTLPEGHVAGSLPLTTKRAWVAPEDIAALIAQELHTKTSNHAVQYLYSDYTDGQHYLDLLQEAFHLDNLTYTLTPETVTRKQLEANHFSPKAIDAMLAMTRSQKDPERFYASMWASQPIKGKTSLADFVRSLPNLPD